MAEVLLLNPRRRKRRKTTSRRRRRRSSSRRRRAAAPMATRRRRRRSSARASRRYKRNVYLANPRRRRRRRSLTASFRRRRRNPSFRGAVGSVMPTLKAGLVGAGGAIGLDFLWGFVSPKLPAQIAGSAIAQYAAKLAGAILIGVIGNKVLRGRGRDLAVGATTVVLHDAIKAQLKASFPTLPLGEYLTYAPTVGSMRRAGRLLDTGLGATGEYLSGYPDQYSPSDTSGGYGGDWNY